MALHAEEIRDRLRGVFEERQAALLGEVITEAVTAGYRDLVRARDFNELKETVRDLAAKMGELAAAQARTEERVGRLEEAMEKLAAAQARTQEEVRRLYRVTADLRADVGGLSRSVAYALENEAYRQLPAHLKQFGLEVREKFVRRDVEGEEVNFFARARRNGREVVLVGEVELKLAKAGPKLRQLERKIAAVKRAYPGVEVVPLLVCHYAKPAALERAREKGVLVVQSFEWQ
jgi:chromosome segregation ATPase